MCVAFLFSLLQFCSHTVIVFKNSKLSYFETSTRNSQVQPVYIREAYRLLQKSIIFVETEDIELEENEEVLIVTITSNILLLCSGHIDIDWHIWTHILTHIEFIAFCYLITL